MEEMRRQLSGGRRFERVISISSGEEFLRAIDEEGRGTLVLVHIFEPDVPACQAMEGSLICLALQYPEVKSIIQKSHCGSCHDVPSGGIGLVKKRAKWGQ